MWPVPMCQASLLCVPHSLPSPEALPQQGCRARGFFFSAHPRRCPSTVFDTSTLHALLLFLLFLNNIRKKPQHPHKHPSSSNVHQVQSYCRHEKSTTPRPLQRAFFFPFPFFFWKVIRSFFLCHCTWRAGWLWHNAVCAGVDRGWAGGLGS